MQTKNSQTKIEYYNCFIQPGQFVFSQDPSWIYAVCGNGVLIILRDKFQCIGGVAHCVFPKRRYRQQPTNYHIDVAIPSLIKNLQSYNTLSHNLEAQLFGGGHLCGYEKKRAEQVVKQVKKILKRKKISIVSEDVGGSLGRKVVFNTHSGEVFVHKTQKIRKTDWMPEYRRARIRN